MPGIQQPAASILDTDTADLLPAAGSGGGPRKARLVLSLRAEAGSHCHYGQLLGAQAF